MENKISVVLEDSEVNSIIQKIDDIDTSLPFLVNIDQDDRIGGFRLGDKNMGFLEKGKDYLEQRDEFLPGHYSIDEVVKDAALSSQMVAISRKLRILADKIDATASIAGMEALSGILAYYNAVKLAAKDNVNGAQTIYDDLSERFPRRRTKKETTE